MVSRKHNVEVPLALDVLLLLDRAREILGEERGLGAGRFVQVFGANKSYLYDVLRFLEEEGLVVSFSELKGKYSQKKFVISNDGHELLYAKILSKPQEFKNFLLKSV